MTATGVLDANGAINGINFARLTDRQRNVLYLICKGFRNGEIACQLGLSPRLVKACASELLLIFDVSNRTELVGTLALENTLFQSPALNSSL
jgi:DNA-binding NarL/FixJ family response regulator